MEIAEKLTNGVQTRVPKEFREVTIVLGGIGKDDFAATFKSNPAIIRNGAQKRRVGNDRKEIFSLGVTA
jgi:hypothetical protein